MAHAQAAGRHCRSIQRDGSLMCNKDTLRSALFERRYFSYAGGACERVFCCFLLCVCVRQADAIRMVGSRAIASRVSCKVGRPFCLTGML